MTGRGPSGNALHRKQRKKWIRGTDYTEMTPSGNFRE